VFNLLHSSTNQKQFEKHLCIDIKVAIIKIQTIFITKGSHPVLPPNRYYLLSAKIYG